MDSTAGNAASADYLTYGGDSGSGHPVGSGFSAPTGQGVSGSGGNGPAVLRYTAAVSTAAPEPGSLVLLALGGLPVVGRVARRRYKAA